MYTRFVVGKELPHILANVRAVRQQGWELVWTPTRERRNPEPVVTEMIRTFGHHMPSAIAVKPSMISYADVRRLIEHSRGSVREIWIDAEDMHRYPRDLRKTYVMKKRCHGLYPEVQLFTTIQTVRRDAPWVLEEHLRRSQEDNIPIGIKLVRGAYRRRPGTHWTCKNDTDRAFEACLDRLWSESTVTRPIRLVVATHNRNNIRSVLERVHPSGRSGNLLVSIAQLRGLNMDDWIDEARRRGVIPKLLVPFGTVWDSIPYLIRRVRENPSMLKYVWMQ